MHVALLRRIQQSLEDQFPRHGLERHALARQRHELTRLVGNHVVVIVEIRPLTATRHLGHLLDTIRHVARPRQHHVTNTVPRFGGILRVTPRHFPRHDQVGRRRLVVLLVELLGNAQLPDRHPTLGDPLHHLLDRLEGTPGGLVSSLEKLVQHRLDRVPHHLRIIATLARQALDQDRTRLDVPPRVPLLALDDVGAQRRLVHQRHGTRKLRRRFSPDELRHGRAIARVHPGELDHDRVRVAVNDARLGGDTTLPRQAGHHAHDRLQRSPPHGRHRRRHVLHVDG